MTFLYFGRKIQKTLEQSLHMFQFLARDSIYA